MLYIISGVFGCSAALYGLYMHIPRYYHTRNRFDLIAIFYMLMVFVFQFSYGFYSPLYFLLFDEWYYLYLALFAMGLLCYFYECCIKKK